MSPKEQEGLLEKEQEISPPEDKPARLEIDSKAIKRELGIWKRITGHDTKE